MSEENTFYQQHFSVDFTYPVVFSENIFDQQNTVLTDIIEQLNQGQKRKTLICIDEGLALAQPDFCRKVMNWANRLDSLCECVAPPRLVPGGEFAKRNWDTVQEILGDIATYHLCRHSLVLAIGGGSMLDIVGLAAALAHRGIRLVRVPSTVLSQCDAGVGVKNGIDTRGIKNFIGTFAPPAAVVTDYSLLESLSEQYWKCGIAEIFKVAIIRDAELFELLCGEAGALMRRERKIIQKVIEKSAKLHLDHIQNGGDPFETGTARPLDFGHWIGHKLEVMSEHQLSHGEAVAIGIAVDVCYAQRLGLISKTEKEKILSALERITLPTYSTLLEKNDAHHGLTVLGGLDDFREHLGGELTITLPKSIGDSVEVHEMMPQFIEEAIAELRDRYHAS